MKVLIKILFVALFFIASNASAETVKPHELPWYIVDWAIQNEIIIVNADLEDNVLIIQTCPMKSIDKKPDFVVMCYGATNKDGEYLYYWLWYGSYQDAKSIGIVK